MRLIALPASEFSDIQTKLGLSDAELGARLYRGDLGESVVRKFRIGERAVPPEIALVMCGFERAHDALAQAA